MGSLAGEEVDDVLVRPQGSYQYPRFVRIAVRRILAVRFHDLGSIGMLDDKYLLRAIGSDHGNVPFVRCSQPLQILVDIIRNEVDGTCYAALE
jgi:hypothetical protein